MDQNAENVESARTVYRELCASFHAIDDFRMRLMGLLPLVTGGGVFLLIAERDKVAFAQPFFRPVGAFGFVVALGLFCYELYGVKRCHGLIELGKVLESALNIKDGQFLGHTRPVAGFINEPFASALIYPAVLAAWSFLAALPPAPSKDSGKTWDIETAQCLAIEVFVVSFLAAILLNLWLKRNEIGGAIAKWIGKLKARA